MSTKVFLGGVPTQPDVDKLFEAFGVPAEGTLIKWDDMERVTGLKYRTCRFNTVVSSWRGKLRTKHQVELGPEPGKGLVCLPPNERLDLSSRKVRSGLRSFGRGVKIAVTTDRSRLTEENRKTVDHFVRVETNIRLAVQAASNGLVLPSIEKA